jgi:hypothetical protein
LKKKFKLDKSLKEVSKNMKNYSYIIFGLFKVIIPVWIGAGNQNE